MDMKHRCRFVKKKGLSLKCQELAMDNLSDFKTFHHFTIPRVDPDPIAISSQDIAMLDIEVINELDNIYLVFRL